MNTIPWGPLGYVTFKRTYARRLIEDNVNSLTEEFPDTVERVIKACKTQLKCRFTEQEETELREIFLNLKGLVAGRFLWQLGTKTVNRLGLFSLQNCAFATVDSIRAFTWAMDALMLGSGVGFNIQKEFVYQLPKVKKIKVTRQDTNDADLIIPDSRQGWIKLLEDTLTSHFITGKDFTYSTVLIRGKGALIKGFGGVSSGPEELCSGITEINRILNNRAGKKIRPIDALDIMNVIGSIVVAGNVRRSAELALGDPDDLQYLSSKRWDLGNIPNYRAMSNNSVVCNDINTLPEQFWNGYLGNGEPFGLINLNLSRKVGRLKETQYPDPDVAGFNPSLRAGTKVWTKEFGIVPIETLQDKKFTVKNLDGNLSKANCWLSGKNKQLVEIILEGGYKYYATEEHKWPVLEEGILIKKKSSELELGMKLPRLKEQFDTFNGKLGTYEEGLVVGYCYGDGWRTIRKDNNRIQYGVCIPKNQPRKMAYLPLMRKYFNGQGTEHKSGTWEFNSTSEYINFFMNKFGVKHKSEGLPTKIWSDCSNDFIEGFLKGLFDADGCYGSTKENRFTFTSVHKKLVEDLHELLGFKGIFLNKTIKHQTSYKFGDKVYNKEVITYQLRRKWDIAVSGKPVKILSVKLTDMKEDVWDISVNDNTHCFQLAGVITGNCSEQSLASYETCCLAEIFLPNIISKKELLKVSKYLYRINKHSLALPCHSEETESIVHKNMRMGIGVTGYLQATEEQRSWLSDTYLKLREYDKDYSEANNFPESIKLTTVKPSGTLSLLAGVTPGVHSAYSQYHLRRIRIASNSPLANICRKHGYYSEYQKNFDGTEDRNTVVVAFPCKVPEGTVLAKDLTAIQQLEYVKRLQTEWSDNAVSCTIYYKKEELLDIKNWLKLYYNDNVKSVSFLLHSDHGFFQAPLEEITKQEYEDYIKLVTPILNGDIKEDDMLDSFECVGGTCPIK